MIKNERKDQKNNSVSCYSVPTPQERRREEDMFKRRVREAIEIFCRAPTLNSWGRSDNTSCKILFLSRENKVHIFKPPCNVLFII